jgi:hypothetical protein
MNPNNKSPNESHDSSIQDDFDYWYSDPIESPNPSFHSTTALSTPSTIEYDLEIEQQMSLLSTDTIAISNAAAAAADDDDDDDAIHNQEQQQTQITSTLSEVWLPVAASTPLLSTVNAANNDTRRSEREIENELFQTIESLVREFIGRPNRECPYYRIMRLTNDQEPKLEYLVTVIINRPTINYSILK